MRLLLLLIQLSVFVPLMAGIDQLFRWLLGHAHWPGVQLPGLLLAGAVLALLTSLLTELDLRKHARREALRAGTMRRM